MEISHGYVKTRTKTKLGNTWVVEIWRAFILFYIPVQTFQNLVNNNVLFHESEREKKQPIFYKYGSNTHLGYNYSFM